MIEPREKIHHYADEVNVGQIHSHRCPYCNAPEKSLSIGRVSIDHYWWKCWRTSCNEHGATAQFIFAPQYQYQAPTFIPRPLPEERALTPHHDADWRAKFKAAGYHLGVDIASRIGFYADEDVAHRVYWDCKAIDGTPLGWQERTDLNGTKTVRTWREAPGPFYYHFNAYASEGPWVIVEDPFSAAVVGLDGGRSLALLGTQLSTALALELAPSAEYVVALDAGAEEAGLSAVGMLRGLGLKVRWMPLRHDLKNLDKQSRQSLLACYGALPSE